MNMPFISSREASPLMKYAFFASLNEINVIFIPKNWISSIYYTFKDYICMKITKYLQMIN